MTGGAAPGGGAGARAAAPSAGSLPADLDALDLGSPDDGEILQQLPPLKAVPHADRPRLLAHLGREASRSLATSPAELPRWDVAAGLDPKAEVAARVSAWISAATASGRRPVLDLGAGVGLHLKELASSGKRVVALERDAQSTAALRRVAGWAAEEANRLSDEAAKEATQKPLVWWAGAGAPPEAELQARRHRPAPVIRADPEAPPFRDESFSVVLAAGVLRHLGEWADAVRRWADLVAPGGLLIVTTFAEKDQDDPSFLSVLGRELWPGVVTAFPRSQDLTWVLSGAGLDIESVSVARVRWTFEEIEARASTEGAGAWRRVLEDASESLRALYEIDEEGMSWRYLTVKAKRPSRSGAWG